MTYLFTDHLAAMDELNQLERGPAATPAGLHLLPLVERAAYRLEGMAAAPRIKIGADVLPWWPTKGVYVLVERSGAPASELVDVPGVGGAWWGGAEPLEPPFCTRDNSGLHIELSLSSTTTRGRRPAPTTPSGGALVGGIGRPTVRRPFPHADALRLGSLLPLSRHGGQGRPRLHMLRSCCR